MVEPASKRPEHKMTFEEWLVWAAEDGGRSELLDGRVHMMAPERVPHARAKAWVWRALQDAIDRARLPCEAFVVGLTIKTDSDAGFEPDVLVNCGGFADDNGLVADNPIIVIEIMSPSSARIDSGRKLREYFRLASVQHYLIALLDGRTVVHHARAADGSIRTTLHAGGTITLDPPGIAMDVAAFFPEPPRFPTEEPGTPNG